VRLVVYKNQGNNYMVHDFPASQWPEIEQCLKELGIIWYVISY
jgi:hypothetical protein